MLCKENQVSCRPTKVMLLYLWQANGYVYQVTIYSFSLCTPLKYYSLLYRIVIWSLIFFFRQCEWTQKNSTDWLQNNNTRNLFLRKIMWLTEKQTNKQKPQQFTELTEKWSLAKFRRPITFCFFGISLFCTRPWLTFVGQYYQ